MSYFPLFSVIHKPTSLSSERAETHLPFQICLGVKIVPILIRLGLFSDNQRILQAESLGDPLGISSGQFGMGALRGRNWNAAGSGAVAGWEDAILSPVNSLGSK